MIRKIILTFFITAFFIQLKAQKKYFFISFKDKDTTNFSNLVPQNFLSAKSVERKKKYNLPLLTVNDLPVNTSYIDSVLPFVNEHLYTLKWFNGIIVFADIEMKDSFKNLKFIKEVTLIGHENNEKGFQKLDLLDKVNLLKKKFEKEEVIDSSLYYGSATKFIYFNNIQKLHELNFKGLNIDIGLIDIGFNNLNNNFYYANSKIKNSYPFFEDQNENHGLSVLGCLAANVPFKYVGSAPEANYYLFSTENVNYEYPIEEYYWARSAEIADSIGIDLISSSLGYTEFDGKVFGHKHKDLNGNKTIIAQAANIAVNNGIAVVVSAGNEGDKMWESISTPADAENVITVGACDEEKKVSSFSSIGFLKHKNVKPEIITIGEDIELINENAKVFYGNGTSYSTPVIAGGIACLMQSNTNKPFLEIKMALCLSASNYYKPNKNMGYGIPDFSLAHKLLNNYFTDTLLNVTQLLDSNLHVSLHSVTKQKIEITLQTTDEKVVYKHKEKMNLGVNRFSLIKSNKLKKGLYILKIKTANSVLIQKVEKL